MIGKIGKFKREKKKLEKNDNRMGDGVLFIRISCASCLDSICWTDIAIRYPDYNTFMQCVLCSNFSTQTRDKWFYLILSHLTKHDEIHNTLNEIFNRQAKKHPPSKNKKEILNENERFQQRKHTYKHVN